MSKIPTRAAARARSLPQDDRGSAAARIVCTALGLAVLMLAVRIAAIW
ncbi:hypothetical protein [uncultured Bradyrhizobium sp.]